MLSIVDMALFYGSRTYAPNYGIMLTKTALLSENPLTLKYADGMA